MACPFFWGKTHVAPGYLVAQSIGSAVNLVVFSGIVMVFGTGTLLLPLAVGAAAGLVFNFLMSKYVVFSQRPKK